MKLSYKQIILKVLADEPTRWYAGYELEKASTRFGWLGIRGTRDCRDLASKGLIEKKYENGYVWYRHKAEIKQLSLI